MIKRLILIIISVLVCAFFINYYFENRAKEQAKEAERKVERKMIEESIKKSVEHLVERTNAIDNWEESLKKGEKFRLEPILTIELERIWLTDRPILFIGAIKDIFTADKESYIIQIEKSLFSMGKYAFLTEIIFELKYPKEKLDLFLTANPDIFKGIGFKNGIAVAANIKRIEKKIVSIGEERHEITIGKGDCIDIVYIGDVIFE
ncbi:MAG: hypothetical protein FJ134_15865 [Deltaproteobacteria bacterium]|nr:hypothetical protein [Deltaproteobacteria bacterium]